MVGAIAVGLGEMNDDIGRVQTSFSADATIETEDITAKSRVYHQPGMVRDEINMGGQQMVMIRRFDLNKFWMILGQGMYMESAADQANDRNPNYKLDSREIVGSETVNGMETTKYKSVYESKDGKFGGFTWYTDDNIAVKAFLIHESKGDKQRFKYEMSNLERSSQSKELFEIPAGYQKLNMGGFGQMPSASQSGTTGSSAGVSPDSTAGAKNSDSKDDAGFAGEVAEEAQDTAKQETKREVRDSVRRGIRDLFGN
ncbi:MAG: hypothetical protein ACR2P6_09015 [Gammaproteobacteria bacterium]